MRIPEPSGLNSRMFARFFSAGVISESSTLEAGPEGEICYGLRRAARFQVAVLIRKPHDRVRVSDVHPLRIWARRIERDAVRPIEATREDLNLLGFGIGSDSAEAFD